jgi:carbonic anhydrase
MSEGSGSDAGDFINWLTFDDETSSALSDVTRIRRHPLVPPSVAIYGDVYDVSAGN